MGSFQLILPTDTIVIDSGFVRGQTRDQLFPADDSMYDDEAAARMDAQIVVTHEHPDHIGGLVAFYPKLPDIARGIRLTAEQANAVVSYVTGWTDVFRDITPTSIWR
jgi:glyoxylase-like metal-dependent hydrolase (beta-lactamase superfamily II)